ncbi:MAG TPA: Ku protein [Terriglobales bacterium]|nr:Ku protein [Terriglobales bacterium]
MPRRKKKAATQASRSPRSGSRAMWTGTINFGLVNIPVELHTAESSNDLDFDMLDKRDFAPIKYRRVNAKSGREVPWSEIVKGYQYEKGEYVALSDADFKNANVEATRSIDIMEFVDRADISPIFYAKPYYVLPLKNGQRAYALLREVMEKSEKVGVAKIVIRTRQHLGALLVESGLLLLNLLRFPQELRNAAKLQPAKNGAVSARELKMAEQLVDSMAAKWQPQKYRDEYRDDLLKLIERKIKSGQTKTIAAPAKASRTTGAGKVVDIMHLLRRSMDEVRKKAEPHVRRKAG